MGNELRRRRMTKKGSGRSQKWRGEEGMTR